MLELSSAPLFCFLSFPLLTQFFAWVICQFPSRFRRWLKVSSVLLSQLSSTPLSTQAHMICQNCQIWAQLLTSRDRPIHQKNSKPAQVLTRRPKMRPKLCSDWFSTRSLGSNDCPTANLGRVNMCVQWKFAFCLNFWLWAKTAPGELHSEDVPIVWYRPDLKGHVGSQNFWEYMAGHSTEFTPPQWTFLVPCKKNGHFRTGPGSAM